MSNQVRLIALLAVALLFSACATPYEAKVTSGLFGSREGFREVQLQGSPDRPDEEVWQVEFRGDNDTNLETAQAYGLYRSATLAIERGYDGFEIVSSLYQLSAISNPLYHKAQWVLLVPFPPPRTMFLSSDQVTKAAL